MDKSLRLCLAKNNTYTVCQNKYTKINFVVPVKSNHHKHVFQNFFPFNFLGQQVKRGLLKPEVMEIVFYIYTPKATGLPNVRQSTWLNPIIDGVEARKLIGQ